MTGNREFDAAAHVLRAPALAYKTRAYIDDDAQSIDFGTLLEHSDPWSHGERLLVDVALDLWNGDGTATLMELIATLDDGNFAAVLEAVVIRRGRIA